MHGVVGLVFVPSRDMVRDVLYVLRTFWSCLPAHPERRVTGSTPRRCSDRVAR